MSTITVGYTEVAKNVYLCWGETDEFGIGTPCLKLKIIKVHGRTQSGNVVSGWVSEVDKNSIVTAPNSEFCVLGAQL